MSKVLVVYYSMYGHVETMAGAIAQGAREIPDTWQPVGLRMFYCGGGRSVHFFDRFR